jgi:hypothetical protein
MKSPNTDDRCHYGVCLCAGIGANKNYKKGMKIIDILSS